MDRSADYGDAAGPRALHNVPDKLLLNIFNSVDYAVLAVDLDERVLTLNAAALSLLNPYPSQIVGRPVEEALRSEQGSVFALLQRVLRRNRAVPGREVVIVDGMGRPVPLWCSVLPLHSSEGKTLGAVITLRPASTVLQDENLDGETDDAGDALAGIVTGDPHMRKLFQILPTIARSNSSVLILGETGTGKSLLAKAMSSAAVAVVPSLRSTAPPCPKPCWSPSCSAPGRELIPV